MNTCESSLLNVLTTQHPRPQARIGTGFNVLGITAPSTVQASVNDLLSRLSDSLTGLFDSLVTRATERMREALDEGERDARGRVEDLRRREEELRARLSTNIHTNPNILTLGNGRVACKCCTEYCFALTHKTQLASTWLSKNGGRNVDGELKYRDHLNSPMHTICVAAARAAGSMDSALLNVEEHARRVVQRQLQVMLDVSKEKGSLRSVERRLVQLYQLGMDVGDTGHSRKTSREMMMTMASVGRNQVKEFLTTPNAMTGGRLPHVGVSADKVTDIGGKQHQIHMFRLNHFGTPVTIMAALIPVTIDYDPDHEASGLACFNKIVEVLSKYGVELFRDATEEEKVAGKGGESGHVTNYVDDTSHVAQYRSSAFDGESAYNGNGPKGLSVKSRIHQQHGIGDTSHEVTHDFAHSCDLLIEDAHSAVKYVKDTMHVTIKQVYSHYSKSPHRLRHLMRRVDQLVDEGEPDVFRALHYLFEVRFVASEFIAMQNFLVDLPIIVAELKDELDLESTKAETRTLVNKWLKMIQSFKFVAYLVVMCDIHEINKQFSVKAQSDEMCIVDFPRTREKYIRSLEAGEGGGEGWGSPCCMGFGWDVRRFASLCCCDWVCPAAILAL